MTSDNQIPLILIAYLVLLGVCTVIVVLKKVISLFRKKSNPESKLHQQNNIEDENSNRK